MHSEVSVLLRFLAATLAALRLCCGDLPEICLAPGCPPSSSEAGAGAGADSQLLGAESTVASLPPLPSDASLAVATGCAVSV